MKSYGFKTQLCEKGDHCTECTSGWHAIKVIEPTPETVEEAIYLLKLVFAERFLTGYL